MRAALIWGWVMSMGISLACAQGSRFVVEIVGAGALTSLLEAHLSVVRASRDTATSKDESQGLVRRGPEQIRELLSTEGYFSAKSSPRRSPRLSVMSSVFILIRASPFV